MLLYEAWKKYGAGAKGYIRECGDRDWFRDPAELVRCSGRDITILYQGQPYTVATTHYEFELIGAKTSALASDDCPHCKGTGKITMFTSVVDCECVQT